MNDFWHIVTTRIVSLCLINILAAFLTPHSNNPSSLYRRIFEAATSITMHGVPKKHFHKIWKNVSSYRVVLSGSRVNNYMEVIIIKSLVCHQNGASAIN